jgi:hypothetical protein
MNGTHMPWPFELDNFMMTFIVYVYLRFCTCGFLAVLDDHEKKGANGQGKWIPLGWRFRPCQYKSS